MILYYYLQLVQALTGTVVSKNVVTTLKLVFRCCKKGDTINEKIIISGGGTGGHIYPAITIYKEIMKQNPDAQVLYVGTERGLEATLVPKEGIEFTTLPVQGLQRKLSFGTLVTLGKTAFSLVKANTIISNF